MASFDEHIAQAKKNLSILSETNSKITSSWDWQVTICFYTAVHLVNAHIAKKADLHYRTHEAVKNEINPYEGIRICAIPEAVYLSYGKLENLSRRSRYLCSDTNPNDNLAHITRDRHFARAVRHLNVMIEYIKSGL